MKAIGILLIGCGIIFVYWWQYLFFNPIYNIIEHDWIDYGILGICVFLIIFGLVILFEHKIDSLYCR